MDPDYIPAVENLFDNVEVMVALWRASRRLDSLHALLQWDQSKPDKADFVGMMMREVVALYERITNAQRTGDTVCDLLSCRRIVFENAFMDTAKPIARLAREVSAVLRKAFIVNPALVANLESHARCSVNILRLKHSLIRDIEIFQLKRKAKAVSIASAYATEARYNLDYLDGEVKDACQRAIDSGYKFC